MTSLRTTAMGLCSLVYGMEGCGGLRTTIALSWSSETADLDLHLLRNRRAELWDSRDDVHYCNLGDPIHWGLPGRHGDATLVMDDLGGCGPEKVLLYRSFSRGSLVVHHVLSTTAEAVEATVHVSVRGEQVAGVSLPVASGDAWLVGTVRGGRLDATSSRTFRPVQRDCER